MNHSSYRAAIILLFIVSLTLFAENISKGIGIYQLEYAKGLQKTGFASTLESEYLYESDKSKDTDSLLTIVWNRLKLNYGINDYCDFQFSIPYGSYLRDGASLYGFGDTYFALKFNYALYRRSLNFALKAGVTIPTGKRDSDLILYRYLTISKKGYDLTFLFDYIKGPFSLHGNLGYFTRDDFKVLPTVRVMNFNYAIGVNYKLIDRLNWNLWLKWEFYTKHSIDNDFKDVAGSQYFGIQTDIGGNFGFNLGCTKELYNSRLIGYRLGLDYSLNGVPTKKPKRLFERYGIPLKIGLVEFDNENIRKTRKKVSKDLDAFLRRINAYNITTYDKSNSNNLTDADKKHLVSEMQRKNMTLGIYGEIISAKYIRDYRFKIPGIIKQPRLNYEIKARVIVVDIATGTILYDKITNGRGSMIDDIKLLDLFSKDNLTFPGITEEVKMKREARENLVKKLIEDLSGNKLL